MAIVGNDLACGTEWSGLIKDGFTAAVAECISKFPGHHSTLPGYNTADSFKIDNLEFAQCFNTGFGTGELANKAVYVIRYSWQDPEDFVLAIQVASSRTPTGELEVYFHLIQTDSGDIGFTFGGTTPEWHFGSNNPHFYEHITGSNHDPILGGGFVLASGTRITTTGGDAKASYVIFSETCGSLLPSDMANSSNIGTNNKLQWIGGNRITNGRFGCLGPVVAASSYGVPTNIRRMFAGKSDYPNGSELSIGGAAFYYSDGICLSKESLGAS